MPPRERMTECARLFVANPPAGVERVLRQMARELLLAQASDWAFLMKTGTAREYATQRTKEHILRFTRLYEKLVTGQPDLAFLEHCEARDNPLPRRAMALLRIALALTLLSAPLAFAQEETPPPEPASKPPVAITSRRPTSTAASSSASSIPPAGSSARFAHSPTRRTSRSTSTATSFNGMADEHGAPCPAGRYSRGGYIVGNDVNAEGGVSISTTGSPRTAFPRPA